MTHISFAHSFFVVLFFFSLSSSFRFHFQPFATAHKNQCEEDFIQATYSWRLCVRVRQLVSKRVSKYASLELNRNEQFPHMGKYHFSSSIHIECSAKWLCAEIKTEHRSCIVEQCILARYAKAICYLVFVTLFLIVVALFNRISCDRFVSIFGSLFVQPKHPLLFARREQQ